MKTLIVLALLTLITACSHPLEIVGDGDIMSASGDRTCLLENFQAGDAVCSKNYAIGAYQETYYATPRAGWQFDHWGNYCADVTDNTCAFDISASAVQKFWGQTVPPLVAVFALDTGWIPASETVLVEGRVWAQPDLFAGLSWEQIVAECPDGICGSGSSLNGLNMEGWVLASAGDVNVLFNSYIGGCALSAYGPDQTGTWSPDSWGNLMFDDGFRATDENSTARHVMGLTSSKFGSDNVYAGAMRDVISTTASYGDSASTMDTVSKSDASIYRGAWFYRAPVAVIGEPITDTVIVDGVEWAQVDLFDNVAKFDMGDTCPGGVCSGVLNGFAMDGWRWAEPADVNALFDHYLSMEPDPCNEDYCTQPLWYRAWLQDGWRPTKQTATSSRTYGFTRQSAADGQIGWRTEMIFSVPITQYYATTIGGFAFYTIPGECTDTSISGVGGWFYRPAAP